MDAKGRLGIENFRNSFRSTNQRINDLEQTAAAPASVSGRFLVNNAGEARAHIIFPVRFSDLPFITFGFEMQGDKNIYAGHAPAMSATAYDWDTIDRPPFSRFYKGAHILVVSTGPPATKFIVNWTAMGTAFTSPSI